MAKNKRNNKELMKLFEGKVTETQIYKKPILYQELRAKLLSRPILLNCKGLEIEVKLLF